MLYGRVQNLLMSFGEGLLRINTPIITDTTHQKEVTVDPNGGTKRLRKTCSGLLRMSLLNRVERGQTSAFAGGFFLCVSALYICHSEKIPYFFWLKVRFVWIDLEVMIRFAPIEKTKMRGERGQTSVFFWVAILFSCTLGISSILFRDLCFKGTLQNWFLLTKQLLAVKGLYVIHHVHEPVEVWDWSAICVTRKKSEKATTHSCMT